MHSRLILCEACGSEGRIYRGHPNDPHSRDDGPCPECNGRGEVEVALEPMDDFAWDEFLTVRQGNEP